MPDQMAVSHVADCCLSQDVRESVFGTFPWKCWFYIINEAHKQYSLLDTIFNYIFYVGPPGKHLYLGTQNQLRLPNCSRFTYRSVGILEAAHNAFEERRRFNGLGTPSSSRWQQDGRLLAEPGCREIGFRHIALNILVLYLKWSS